MSRRNPDAGRGVFWVKLRQRGYSRSITGLYRFLKKQDIMAVHQPIPKLIPKPYGQIEYPGQRIQVDVKFVPSACLKKAGSLGSSSSSTLPLTSISDGALWKPLSNVAPILARSLWNTL